MVDRRRLIAAAIRAARVHATPFYLFDPACARDALRRWREAAGSDAWLFYPWKCNRHEDLVALARAEGFGAEVTAAEDLEAALLRDAGPRVLFQGPAKPDGAIDRALAAEAWLSADSEADAEAILARALALGAPPRYLLRLRPAAAEPAQRAFGLPPDRAVALCARLARARRPLPQGLAFHLGTGIPSAGPYRAALRETGEVAGALRGLGVGVAVVDVGGGFAALGEARRNPQGRPRGASAGASDFLDAIRAQLRRSLPDARLFLEPGRAIAADAFHLVTRVVRAGARRIHVDASRISHAFFVARGRHPFLPIPRRAGRGTVEVRGPLPVDLDLFGARESIGGPRDGDLLVIGSVGAYNLVAASSWAGSVPDVVEMGLSASGSADGRPSCAPTRPSRRSPHPRRPST